MADNVTFQTTVATPPTGTIVATDEIGSVHYQLMKLAYGPLNAADLVTTSAGLPVAQQGTWTVTVGTALPAGDAAIGRVKITDGTDVVSIITASSEPTGAAKALLTASVIHGETTAGGGTYVAVKVTPSGAVSIDGTVTADTELPAAAALGDNTANPTAPAVGSFPHVWDGATWDRWTGAVSQSGSWTVAVSGTVTVSATNLDIRDLTSASDSVAAVQSGAWSVSVTGTATVDTELPAAAALADNTANPTVPAVGAFNMVFDGSTWDRWTGAVSQSGSWTVAATQSGTWTVQPGNTPNTTPWLVSIHDGTTRASVADLTNSNPLHVAIVDGTGSQITSFGGGTQYTEGDTDASITGTAMLWEDTSDTLRAVSAAKPLPVAIISGAGSGGTALQDGAVFTPDTTNFTPVGGYRDDTSPATVTEGDGGACRITTNRALHVNLRDASGNEVSVGGGTQYDEDTAHVTADKLTLAGAVRRDTAASGVDADGDRATINVDSTGRLWAHVGTIDGGTITTITNAVTVQDGGNVISVDDGGASLTVDGTVSISGTVTVDSELTTADLDTGAGTDTRAVVGLVLAASGGGLLVGAANPMPVGDNGGSLTVDGTVAATQSGGWTVSVSGAVDTELAAAAALADNTANPTVTSVGVFPHWYDGATWDRATGNAADGLLVNLGANNDVTVTGTVSVSGTVTVDTELPTAAALADNAANPTAPAVGAFNMVWDGSTWDRWTGAVSVSGTVTVTATNLDIRDLASGTDSVSAVQSGTWNIATVTTVTTVSTVTAVSDAQVQGKAAHDTAVSGNPVLMGAASSAAAPTDVTADGEAVRVWALRNGSQVCNLAAGGTLITATSSSLNVNVSNASLAVTATNLDIRDLTSGSDSVAAVQSGTWTVQPGNTPNTTPWLVTDTPATSGGLTMHKTVSAASTNATSVKASAGQVYSVQAFNTNASARYLKLYNKASAPSVGSDTPVKTLLIPGATTGAGVALNWDKGLAFGTGIAFALTTGPTDADTGAVAANEIVIGLDYK